MGFFDYTQARKIYRNDKTMLQVIDALEDMDQYHLLRRSSINKVSFELPDTAVEIKTWLAVCDGGLLFSTTLLGCDD